LLKRLKTIFFKNDVTIGSEEDDDESPWYAWEETKLTKKKMERAKQALEMKAARQIRSNERLPPGQTLTQNFPILDLGTKPIVSKEDWSISLCGSVERPVVLDWEQFHRLPHSQSKNDIHCVTGWSKFDTSWSGVSARTLIDIVKPSPTAVAVLIHGSDGYTTNLTLEDFATDDVVIATSLEGGDIPLEHGGPARLVVPHLYFWKSAKWINSIHFLDINEDGFWEKGGYHERGDPWLEQRFRWS
jgi:DMSO/TMAO reductase YedYZ molybdopterin-dependent catalytic subunit